MSPASPSEVSAPADLAPILARESPPCALCGGERFEGVLRGGRDWVWRKPGDFTLARCADCGLVMTRPRPAPAALALYYAGAYSGEDHQRRVKKPERGDAGLPRLINGYRLGVMSRVRPLTPEDRVLDVGCNRGSFLWLARERSGCALAGVDIDQGSLDEAMCRDVADYRAGSLREVGFEAERFTVVCFFESLEHTPDPLSDLREAWRLLRPGGLLVVEVPDFGGWWRVVFGRYWLPLLLPQHLVHFTRDTLTRAVVAAGFEPRLHRSMFYPLEGVASLGNALGHLLRSPPLGSPPSWRTPLDVLVGLALVLLWFVLEVPSQLLLRLIGRTGHQLLIAQKPAT